MPNVRGRRQIYRSIQAMASLFSRETYCIPDADIGYLYVFKTYDNIRMILGGQ